ncbi:helix-turn-helix domain-containing protein [Paenibacillus algorifonticola]|uniref:helix-turn-helix domain-containing protein n=1 Tax=Paenibacillus algorifonticola TaxID=684063 RepID=UPI003D273641
MDGNTQAKMQLMSKYEEAEQMNGVLGEGMEHTGNELFVFHKFVAECELWEAESRRLTSYVILVIMEGQGMLEANGGIVQVTKGHMLLAPPGSYVQLSPVPHDRFIYAEVQFEVYSPVQREGALEPQSIQKLPNWGMVRPGEAAILFMESFDLFKLQINKMAEYSNRTSRGARYRLQAVFHEMLESMVEEGRQVPITSDLRYRMDQIIHYMQLHYKDELTLDAMAGMSRLSKVHFSRLFKRKMGTSPLEYLTTLRINRSKELLLQAAGSMKNIANEAGYRDELYFSRIFKKRTGLTPTQYAAQPPKRLAAAWSSIAYYLFALELDPCLVQEDPYLCHPNELNWNRSTRLDNNSSWQEKWLAFQQVKPDVILCYEFQVGWQEKLRSIAPVIQIPWFHSHLLKRLAFIAQLTNRQLQAEAWLRRYAESAEEGRIQIANTVSEKETFTLLMLYGGDVLRVYGGQNVGHVFYHALKLRPVASIAAQMSQDADFGFVELSGEAWREYDADWMIVFMKQDSGAAAIRWEQLQQTKEWTSLQAVQTGRVRILDADLFLLYDPLAIEKQLGRAVDALMSPLSLA